MRITTLLVLAALACHGAGALAASVIPSGDSSQMGFRVQSPWIEGGELSLRLPAGLTVSGTEIVPQPGADADLAQMPAWGTNEYTGSLSCLARTRTGIEFGSWARPVGDGVDFQVHVRNRSRRAMQDVQVRVAVDLRGTVDFGHRLIAVAWDGGSPVVVGPASASVSLEPAARSFIAAGGEAVWKGRVYLLDRRPGLLQQAWQADFGPKGRLTDYAVRLAASMRRPRLMLNPSNQFANVIRGEGRAELYNEGLNLWNFAVVAKRYLDADGRIDTFISRDRQDERTSLYQEALLTNNLRCNALIALHSDATGNNTPGGGTWTFYTSEKHLRPGEKENLPYPLEDSKRLADLVQTRVVQTIHQVYPESEDRGVKEHWVRLYMTHRPQCPSVLIEILFHTNPKERELLKQPGFHESVGRAIAQAAIEFFEGPGAQLRTRQ